MSWRNSTIEKQLCHLREKGGTTLNLATLFLILILIGGCRKTWSPKPRAYPRIHYPERGTDQLFDNGECPFTFRLPDYYSIVHKNEFFGEVVENPCWGLNLHLEQLNGTFNLTYKELKESQPLEKLSEDAYRLTFKHAQKADYIVPHEIDNGHDVFGLLYEVGGDAASPLQFFVTDTSHYFVRGSLNFYTQPNADSLAPVVSFMREDLEEMITSWRWK